VLSAGKLNINSTTALGTGLFTIGDGTTIDNTSGAALTVANAQNWNGSFTVTGTNDLTFNTGAITLGAASTVTVAAGA
jgi:hypothetical protein